MSTNYYGRKIPKESDYHLIVEKIKFNNWNMLDIHRFADQFVDTIHIGKCSAGWDFLFNLNGKKYYQNKEELISWLKSVEIVNEYGVSISFDDFWDSIVCDRKFNGQPTKTHRSDAKYSKNYIVIDNLEFLDCEFC